jgi:hypothetical protein
MAPSQFIGAEHMSTHELAEYRILIDGASNYILAHAAGAGLTIQPPVWDGGREGMTTATHRLRIATESVAEELSIPHEWLPPASDGHNRFRTEVEATLARLRSRAARR